MSAYPDTLTIRQALNQFFEKHNLGEKGGLNNRWAYLQVGKFRIPFPNTESRKKALVFHDIHHLVTGYASDWKGEAQISAWEISTGCEDYFAAWVLDIWGLFMGLVLYPRATYAAFIRGRRTLNLYKHLYTESELMQLNIPEIQHRLHLDKPISTPSTTKEKLSFIAWAIAAVAASFIPFILPYILLGWWLLGRV